VALSLPARFLLSDPEHHYMRGQIMFALMILLVTMGLALAMLGLQTYHAPWAVPIAHYVPGGKCWLHRTGARA